MKVTKNLNAEAQRTQKDILDCGGRAQRRHRFSADKPQPTAKAAWRFASRRSPKWQSRVLGGSLRSPRLCVSFCRP